MQARETLVTLHDAVTGAVLQVHDVPRVREPARPRRRRPGRRNDLSRAHHDLGPLDGRQATGQRAHRLPGRPLVRPARGPDRRPVRRWLLGGLDSLRTGGGPLGVVHRTRHGLLARRRNASRSSTCSPTASAPTGSSSAPRAGVAWRPTTHRSSSASSRGRPRRPCCSRPTARGRRRSCGARAPRASGPPGSGRRRRRGRPQPRLQAPRAARSAALIIGSCSGSLPKAMALKRVLRLRAASAAIFRLPG